MIKIDIHEPAEALTYLGQSVECDKVLLNEKGKADYLWQAIDGQEVQVERKQWLECFTKMDAVEDQLRRHLKNSPEARLILLIEGFGTPVLGGMTQLRATNQNRVYVMGGTTSIRYAQAMAWLYQINKFIEVYHTASFEATCTALVSWYKADQKVEHTTFQRHFKEVSFHPNPAVAQLMGLLPGVGEKKAEALIERFNTVYNVVTATPAQLSTVPGIGVTLSRTILQRIGRPDV